MQERLHGVACASRKSRVVAPRMCVIAVVSSVCVMSLVIYCVFHYFRHFKEIDLIQHGIRFIGMKLKLLGIAVVACWWQLVYFGSLSSLP